MRCLDVGTMDGFWAFEMEQRGAGEVVASDVPDTADRDAPPQKPIGGRNPRVGNFDVAASLRGSSVEYRVRNVYDLNRDEDGEFDLVFMGFVLQMLRDPLRGLEAIRRVCRGSLILLDTVSLPLSVIPSPLARLDARHDGFEYFVFNRRGLRHAVELAGFAVEAATPILQDGVGPAAEGNPAPLRQKLIHRFGFRGRSAAVRARPLPSRR